MMPHRLILKAGLRAATRSRSSATAPVTEGCPFHGPLQAADDSKGIKPFSSIPGPKGLPLLGSIVDITKNGGPAKLHEYIDKKHKEFGPIFKDAIGPVKGVIISKKEYIQRTYVNEGRFPEHLVPEPWLIYNKMRGITRGLFFMNGEHWFNRRQLLNHTLMAPNEVDKHGRDFNNVISDVMDRWENLAKSSDDGVVPNLENELYNWSIESLGTMVFGRRLGCVTPASQKSELHEFVHYVQQIFTESATMSMIPPKLAYWLKLPVWNRFVKAADRALELSRFYVEQRISEIQEAKKKGHEVRGVLSKLLDQGNIPNDEIVTIVADLILAAADTTSHATQWALYLLAKNPECQEQFLSEIQAAAPNGQLITEQLVNKIPYSNYVIKEALRMYPIASFLTRTLPKKIVFDDYEIPKGKLIIMSQFTVGRDEEQFPNPNKFSPERWRRSNPRTIQSHSCMPFGIGIRACIGRRVAELKMRLLLSRMVQQFHLESANTKDVGIALRLITTPDQPIKIRLARR